MKKVKVFLVLVFSILGMTAQAQKKTEIGFNLMPISAGSYELVTERKINKRLAVSVKAGYASEQGLRFILKKDDGIDNKKHSGFFGKVGLKYYFTKGFFLLGNIIYSNYHNSGEINTNGNKEIISSSGGIWALGLTPGYKFALEDNNRLFLTLGIQVGFAQSRNDLVGIRGHNYQPGLGPVGNTYCQPILAFTYRI